MSAITMVQAIKEVHKTQGGKDYEIVNNIRHTWFKLLR